MKKNRKILICFLLGAIMAVSMVGFVLTACSKDKKGYEEAKAFLNEEKNLIEFGIEKDQKLIFRSNNGEWSFDGVSVYAGKNWDTVIAGELSSTIIDETIKDVRVVDSNKDSFSVEVEGANYKILFSAQDGSPFVKRAFTFNLTNENLTEENGEYYINEGDIRLYVKTVEDRYLYEKGYIANASHKDTLQYIYSTVPVIYTNVYSPEESLRITTVLDFYNSSAIFNRARRFYNEGMGAAQIGYISGKRALEPGEYTVIDYLNVSDGTDMTYYTQQEMMSKLLTSIEIYDYNELWEYDNRAIDTYEDACFGLVNELIDERATNDNIMNSFCPYAYSSGWSESITGLEVLRGMVKYAELKNDVQFKQQVLEMAKVFVGDKGWIADLNGMGQFLYYGYSGTFIAYDTVEGNIGTFKCFERINYLGEIAVYTNNEELKEGYLSLMPLMRTKMVGPDYLQPIDYSPTLEMVNGTDGGGNAGAMSMWAYSQLLAYQLTDENDKDTREMYLDDAIGSLKKAASLDFDKMNGIYEEQKPTAIAWAVRGFVKLYEITGKEEYLNEALRIANGLWHFAYYNTNPYSTFYNGGFMAACASANERYAAFWEVAETLWMTSNLLKYTDDMRYLDFYAKADYAMLWQIPANGEGISNSHKDRGDYNYEWIESQYIPFEFPEGGKNDPSYVYGSQDQRVWRQTKEIYGSGEMFNLFALFEGHASAVNQHILTLSLDAVSEQSDLKTQRIKMYNPTDGTIKTTVKFPNFKPGKYVVKVDGKKVGEYTERQLLSGLSFTFTSGEVKMAEVIRQSSEESANVSLTNTLAIEATNMYSNRVDLSVKGGDGLAYFVLEACRNDQFNPKNTFITYSEDGKFSDKFTDGELRYYRVKGFDGKGACTEYSAVYRKDSVMPNILASDDFSTISGWNQVNTEFLSNRSLGIMNILSTDTGNGVSSVSKVFSGIAFDKDPVLEFYPFSKSSHSTYTVKIKIGSETYTLMQNESQISQYCYSFDLKEMIQSVGGTVPLGKVDVAFELTVSGTHRGFALEMVRFVGKQAGTERTYFDAMTANATANKVELNTQGGLHRISSLDAQSQLFRYFDTNALNSTNAHYMVIKLADCRILDKVMVKITQNGKVVSDKSHYVMAGLELHIDLKEEGVALGDNTTFSVEIYDDESAGIYQAPNAYIVQGLVTADPGYAGEQTNIIKTSIPQTHVVYDITLNASKTPYFVFGVSDFTKYTGAEWKVYLRNKETGVLYEMRIKEEIQDFDDPSDYLTGANGAPYFRAKTGQFVYNVGEIIGNTEEEAFELIVALDGGGSIEIHTMMFMMNNAVIGIGNGRASV